MKSKYCLICTLTALMHFTYAFAQENLLAYEPFPYASGNLEGKGGSTSDGFSGAWETQVFEGSIYIIPDSLVYEDRSGNTLLTEGGAVEISKGAGGIRSFDTSSDGPFADYSLFGTIGLQTGGTIYFSHLWNHDELTGSGNEFGNPVTIMDLTGNLLVFTNPIASDEKFGDNYYIFRPFNDRDLELAIAETTANSSQLLVIKIEFIDGTDNDRISFYLNPLLEAEGSNTPDLVFENMDVTFNDIKLARFNGLEQNKVVFDELRFGKTWESITPYEGGQPLTTIWPDDQFPPTPEGYKSTGIGWLTDAAFPWVGLYASDGLHWLYIAPGAELDGFYAYDLSLGTWVWSTNAFGGWYYDFSIADWARW